MRCEVDYYRTSNGNCPVEEFLDSLPNKLLAKNMRAIELLEENGTSLPYPHAKKIEGKTYKGLWELRVKQSTNHTRIFYFYFPSGNRAILLSGYKKESNSTPEQELDRAKKYMKEAIERNI